jgi:hypothetical protein
MRAKRLRSGTAMNGHPQGVEDPNQGGFPMKTILKPLAVAAMSIAMLAQTKAADSVPVKFQGTWVMEKGNGPWRIGAKTIDFGSGFKSEITSVKPGNEDGDVIVVTWGRNNVEIGV